MEQQDIANQTTENLEKRKRPTAITIICILGFVGAAFFLVQCSSPDKEFQQARLINTIQGYQEFIKKYPDHSAKAKFLIDSIKFFKADSINLKSAFIEFIETNPDSAFLIKAETKVDSFSYNEAIAVNTKEALSRFLETPPKSKYHTLAKNRLSDYRIILEKFDIAKVPQSLLDEDLKIYRNKPLSGIIILVKPQWEDLAAELYTTNIFGKLKDGKTANLIFFLPIAQHAKDWDYYNLRMKNGVPISIGDSFKYGYVGASGFGGEWIIQLKKNKPFRYYFGDTTDYAEIGLILDGSINEIQSLSFLGLEVPLVIDSSK